MNALFTNITTDYGVESFDVLAIPTNNFGLQEPGANSEIMSGLRYVRPGGDFVPLYKVAIKNSCNGLEQDPLFTFLKDACHGTSELLGDTDGMYWSPVRMHDYTWNFEKIIVDQQGKPVKRFSPSETVNNLRPDIIALLEANEAEKKLEQVELADKVIKEPKVEVAAPVKENKVPQHPFKPHLNMKRLLHSKLHHP